MNTHKCKQSNEQGDELSQHYPSSSALRFYFWEGRLAVRQDRLIQQNLNQFTHITSDKFATCVRRWRDKKWTDCLSASFTCFWSLTFCTNPIFRMDRFAGRLFTLYFFFLNFATFLMQEMKHFGNKSALLKSFDFCFCLNIKMQDIRIC